MIAIYGLTGSYQVSEELLETLLAIVRKRASQDDHDESALDDLDVI